jgi:hypothetical protein
MGTPHTFAQRSPCNGKRQEWAVGIPWGSHIRLLTSPCFQPSLKEHDNLIIEERYLVLAHPYHDSLDILKYHSTSDRSNAPSSDAD